MDTVARPWVTAGVALAASGMIAVTPVAPLPVVPMSDIQLSAFDPITPWVDTFGTAFDNARTIANDWVAAPFPVLQQILVNSLATGTVGTAEPGYAADVATTLNDLGHIYIDYFTTYFPSFVSGGFDELASGNITVGLNSLLQAALAPVTAMAFAAQAWVPLAGIPAEIATNLVNGAEAMVVRLPQVALTTVTSLPLGSVAAVTASLQGIFDGLTGAGGKSIEDALDALVNIPAGITDAILNGVPFPYIFGGGLADGAVLGLLGLSIGSPPTEIPGGLIAQFLTQLPQLIAAGNPAEGLVGIGWDGLGMPLDAMGGLDGLVNAPFDILAALFA